jgi:general secretion pathway protein G
MHNKLCIINNKQRGFTLLEHVVIIIGILYSIAQIKITGSITYAKETALKNNLYTLRKAIDDYYADRSKYPSSLQDLVDSKYIRNIPEEPFTKSTETWTIIPSEKGNDVFDIKCSSTATGNNGKPYNEW